MDKGQVTEKDLVIDKYALDEMVMQHPELYARVSAQYVTALGSRDKAKEDLTVLQATRSIQRRAECAQAGTKLTETALNELVLTDPQLMAATERYREHRLAVEKLMGLREAFMQRGYALKELVALHGAGYFGTASESRPQPVAEVNEKRRAISKRVRATLS